MSSRHRDQEHHDKPRKRSSRSHDKDGRRRLEDDDHRNEKRCRHNDGRSRRSADRHDRPRSHHHKRDGRHSEDSDGHKRLPRDGGGRVSRHRHSSDRSHSPSNHGGRRRSLSSSHSRHISKQDGNGLLLNIKEGHRDKPDKPPAEKLKPNFETSGKLAQDTNTFNGVVIKYNQPPEAKVPKRKWRLYPFKGDQELDFIPIHTQSAFLLGRDRRVADIPIDHPSCSQQHAAIQFRSVSFERNDGSMGKKVRPYVIDLESANGTFLNNKRIASRKYFELLEKDVLKFGFSSRDYVVMHEDVLEEDFE